MSNPQHSTKSNEHYTPVEIVEAARSLMGGIDLDPASCELANQTVKANRFYSSIDDALNMEPSQWAAKSVFLNPPGGLVIRRNEKWVTVNSGCAKSSMAIWWEKLYLGWLSHEVKQAIFVAFSIEIISKQPEILNYPICITTHQATADCIAKSGRIRFNKPDDNGGIKVGVSPTHSNVIVYLPINGRNTEHKRFAKHFHKFGSVGLFKSLV